MRITFVIPVLNGEKFIRACLKSIFAEKMESDDVVVVDNGSTDKTMQIVNSFAEVQVMVAPGLTVASLRNLGAEESLSSLFAFIDADCVLCNGWRQTVIRTFSNNSIHAAGSLYDIPIDACWIEKAWFSQKESKIGRAKYINSGNLIVRSEVYKDLAGFDQDLISDEDCEFGERLNSAGYCLMEVPEIRVVHLGNPKSLLAFYKKEKWHATSALNNLTLRNLDRPTIMTILFGISMVIAILLLTFSEKIGYTIFCAACTVLFVPVGTAVFRAHQFKNYRYILELTLLWLVFYMVRMNNMFHFLVFKVGR